MLLCLTSIELIWGLSNLLLFSRTQERLFTTRATPPLKIAALSDHAMILPLFGDSVVFNDANVVLSPLNVTLVGIFYAPDQTACEVILQMPDKQERVFHVGDTIVAGAQLKQVQRDEIFIVRQGQVERLSLPEKGLHFDPPAQPLL
jgi:type II secretory pathway component PulC